LGEEFLGCVDACLKTLCRSPGLYEVIPENDRRALVRRFPYANFYEPIGDVVSVYCVFHTSRNPQKWRQRLP
jgi:hypothetical protein